ncbi:hypothetical protein QBC38DRAFT_182807 [Podospora fimiseda]|uniref:Uncharacterized protein n=1 Tax=Podospora fimiseda TaxID=252190 RepID=A0AAN7GZF8_9PEZI|nr:hypothetical protein QBC38DRAFT_182807 [Podospora fimiseda]
MPRQATFSVVPETLAPQPGAVLARPMTSKQAQKLYREKTKMPKMSRQEMRRWELVEQERIRKELEKDNQLNRARFLREKKKEKEREKLQAKKKSGQPIAPPRPSQPMITAFARKKVPEQKKEPTPPPPPSPSPLPAPSPSPPHREPDQEIKEQQPNAIHEYEGETLVEDEEEERASREIGISSTPEQPVAEEKVDASTILDEVLHSSLQPPKSTSNEEEPVERQTEQQRVQPEHERVVPSSPPICVLPSSPPIGVSGTMRTVKDGPRYAAGVVVEPLEEFGPGVQIGKQMDEKGLPKGEKCTWSRDKSHSTPTQQTPSRSPGFNKENKRIIPSTQAFNLEAEEIDWDCIMVGAEKHVNAMSRAIPPPPPPRRPAQVTPRSAQATPKAIQTPPSRATGLSRSSTSNVSRPLSNTRPPTTTRSAIEEKRVSNGVQKPKYLPPHMRAQPSHPPARTPGPKAQPLAQHSPNQPPTSTQLFLLSNFDELFPSVSQEARELGTPVAKTPKPPFKHPSGPAFLKPGLPSKVVKPPLHARSAAGKPAFKPTTASPAAEIPFLSTQDLVMSTQDLQEIKVPTPLRTGPPVFLKPKSQTSPLSQTGRPVAPGRQFLTKRR